jgi:hypothetical protein
MSFVEITLAPEAHWADRIERYLQHLSTNLRIIMEDFSALQDRFTSLEAQNAVTKQLLSDLVDAVKGSTQSSNQPAIDALVARADALLGDEQTTDAAAQAALTPPAPPAPPADAPPADTPPADTPPAQ